MRDNIFKEEYTNIDGEEICLRLIDTYEGTDKELPFYWWEIVLKPDNVTVGKISFRIGQNYHSYFNGNIGYEVDEAHRGNNYAFKACQLLTAVAICHNMNHIYLVCDYDNVASYKTIEKLGAKFVEEIQPPEDYVFYYEGIPKQKIYELTLE